MRLRDRTRLQALTMAMAVMVGCSGGNQPDYSGFARELCLSVDKSGSSEEQLQLVADFLDEHPEFAGGAFDAPTLTGLVEKSLSSEMIKPPAEATDEARRGECQDFVLSHWLIGSKPQG